MAGSTGAASSLRRYVSERPAVRTALGSFAFAVGVNAAWALPWGLLRPGQRVTVAADGRVYSDAAAIAQQFPQYALWVIASSAVAMVLGMGAYRRCPAAPSLWTMAAVVGSAAIGALMAFDLGNWLAMIAHPLPDLHDVEVGDSAMIAVTLTGRVGVVAAAGVAALSYWVSVGVGEQQPAAEQSAPARH
ncbi:MULTISPECIES: hypothetical protein [unclassified Corynebacterium]|uniref:hypothetical protein n=1 Tax=unclassified Corynebacterium TaxID=2624378 RepID=UPI001C45B59A|nr:MULTISPECIES: hypothetical protein [unclassified Corynebacterium]MBV7281618.1 hypothetical protein [Corynebacterium sp. TAE3-ERU30]MBV7301258.1 hypothetical protein [Corynebacterium sp. TAE3-ERU2]